MTEVTPYSVKIQGFHHFLILLFYDHLPIADLFLFMRRCCILKWYIFLFSKEGEDYENCYGE